MPLYILFESASGYALFERLEGDEIGDQLDQLQESVKDMSRFGKVMRLKAFQPFASEKEALESVNSISEGEVEPRLRQMLEANLPKGKTKAQLAVADEKLAASLQEALGLSIVIARPGNAAFEIMRGIRMHFASFLKDFRESDLEKAQLGLAHAYSRGKVKFNVNRVDNMIIQSISLLDQLDKDINTFAMRVREWYSWHFPELVRLIPDNITYARAARIIGNKSTMNEEKIAALEELLESREKANEVAEAARHSMGTDISELDLANIERFTSRVVDLAEYRKKLHAYMQKKMADVAPNLSELVGEVVAARLIAHAGSLTNLAKYPASTVQILGAEKALFRALKTRGATPKYGLIFHSSFIGRASAKNKGRISRYLANKCSIAARIDSFSETPLLQAGPVFGHKMKEQVEERLKFYDSGVPPRKNLDVMHEALEEARAKMPTAAAAGSKRPAEDAEPASEKKKKKKKKRKHSEESASAPTPMEISSPQEEGEKKKKKKHKKEKKKKKDKKKEKDKDS